MQSLIILGNGPSLKSVDLKTLEYQHTFGLNNAYLKYEELDFYPNYHAWFQMGPAVFDWQDINRYIKEHHSKVTDFFFYKETQSNIDVKFSNIKYINVVLPSDIKFDMSKYALPLNIELEMALHKVQMDEYDKFSKFVIGSKKKDLINLNFVGMIKSFKGEKLNDNDFIRLPRFKTSWFPPKSFKDFIFSGGNSTVIACLIGYLMGYEKIILLGVDMDWKIFNNIVDTNKSYWYSEYFMNHPYDVRKFCQTCTSESIYKMHLAAWMNFKEMIEVNNLNLKIINCTENSKLTIFPMDNLANHL